MKEQIRGHLSATSRTEPRRSSRGRIQRAVVVVAAFAALAALVTACGNSGASSSPATEGTSESAKGGSRGGTLRIGIGTDLTTLDPAAELAGGQFAATVLDLIYAPIFHMTPEGEIEPALATSWHYAKDTKVPNSVFEFTLRKDAAYSDGTPVTASTVARWLTYFANGTGSFHGLFGESPKFSAIDKYTVKVVPETPNPAIPQELSDGGLNAGFVLGPKGMDNPKALAKETNGAGPYMLDSSQSLQGDHYTLVPNPHYYAQSEIHFSKVEVKVISDAATRLQAQVSGQLDVAEGDAQTAASAEGSGLEVVGAPFNVIFLALNTKERAAPQLEDVRVREAMNLAINRSEVTEALFGDYAIPTSSYIPSDFEPKLEDYWQYDPTKAKKLLAEAGYAKGFTLKAITPGPFYGTLGEPLMQAAAKNLSEVGIKLDITPYNTEPEYGEALYAGDAAFSVATVGAGIFPTPSLYGTWLAPEAPANWYGVDPVLDRLYEEGAQSDNPPASWQKMWERFTSQGYVVPLVAYDYLNYVSDGFGGVELGKKRPVPVPSEWYVE